MDRQFSEAQVAEGFHLAFLSVLQARMDQTRYVLKGGANLRFFFGSPRYSEDIDLDIVGAKPWALAEVVDKAIESPAMRILLRGLGLEIAEYSKPKQTGTTNRWKVAIAASALQRHVRTKIEFSSRGGDDRFVMEPLPQRLADPYGLRSPQVQHYRAEAALEQKIAALAGRSETQARDVFDLDLLFRQAQVRAEGVDPQVRGRAAERAMELPWEAFQDQVIPFIDFDVLELYRDESVWDQIVLNVVENLGAER